MPFTYTLEDGLVHFRWSGVLTLADLQSISEVMPAVARQLGRAPQVLHNFDAVTSCDFPPIAAYEHSQQRRGIPIPNPVKSATIATTSEIRAMARVFQAVNHNPNLRMEIFGSEAAARAWLKAP